MSEPASEKPEAADKSAIGSRIRSGLFLVATLAVIAFLIGELVSAPIQDSVTLKDCIDRYAKARTSSDSTVVNLLRYTDSTTGKRKMCGSLRPVTVIKL
jgi:uncharacterized membrane protein YhiD involved in acid resistance